MSHSVRSGAPSTIAVRRCPLAGPISSAATTMKIAGGISSNIIPPLLVIVFRPLQHVAESFCEHDHGKAGQEAERCAETEPAVDAKIAFHVNDRLRQYERRQHDDEYPPEEFYRCGPRQPVIVGRKYAALRTVLRMIVASAT